MSNTSENHIGDEQRIDMLVVVSDGLQVQRNTNRKRDNKWSLVNESYFGCSAVDAVADAGTDTMPMVSANWKLRTSESMTN